MSTFFKKLAGERPPYPSDWPPLDYFVEEKSVKVAVQLAFSNLLQSGATETDADVFLREHPALLTRQLFSR